MSNQKLWVTEIRAIDYRNGILKTYGGPEVPGNSHEEAQQYCQDNGLGYCKVLGEWILDDNLTDKEFENMIAGMAQKN